MKSYCTIVALVAVVASIDAAGARQPNIVLIVTDDQGVGDLSCNGNPVLETPNIDRLASEGVQLTRFYVSPVCSPTRASLMTGRYNYRTGVFDTYVGRSMMRGDEVTLAERLKAAGYATGIFGKWHLGDNYPMRPQDQGFDDVVVFRGGGLAQPSEPLENNNRYTNPILWRGDQQFTGDGYCTDVFFREAQRFIRQSAADGKPFFAYVATNAPHGPYHDVPTKLYEKYKSKDLDPVLLGNTKSADTVARIFAMIENIDENVGSLLDMLDEAELADDTIVLFMSDNGPNTPRYVGRRRGKKTEVLEGGIISPLIVRWPKVLPAGKRLDLLAAHIDLAPTLMAAVEGTMGDGQVDGRNLLPKLEQLDGAWDDDRKIVLQAHRGFPARRHQFAVVGSRYKLVRPSGFGRFSAPAKAPTYLFDIVDDPVERLSLFDDQGEIAQDYLSSYDRWFDDVSRSDPAATFRPPSIVVGTRHQPTTILTWQDWQADGDGWGKQGYWLVDAPRTAKCRVTVILQKPHLGTAVLTWGGKKVEQEVSEPMQRIVLEDFTAPQGEARVAFRLYDGERQIPPYQIELDFSRSDP